MKPSLQVRLSQHLALTPQLQQSIRLLQLSTLELHQEVEQMLEANPFLEMEEDSGPTFEPLSERLSSSEQAGERETERAAESNSSDAGGDDTPGVDSAEYGATEREDWENGTERDDFDGIRETPGSSSNSGSGESDDLDPQDRRAASGSLQDHLRAQALGMRLSDDDRAALEVLIE
ncbi:MAG: RNA polymerase factor sigma-54, partial [Rhizobacter sp.]